SYTSWAASGQISRNGEPGSSRVSMRSRGKSFPRPQWRAWACSPPPCAICSSCVRSGVSSRSMALRLAAYSGEWTSSWVWNMAMVSPNDRQGARGDLAALLEQLPADQHSPDFTGAGADLVQLGITQQAASGVVIDIAVAPEDLDGIQRGAGRLFGGIDRKSVV